MKTQEAIQFFGSPDRLKAALQLPTRKVRWGEHPPLERQYQIEVVTNGALKAERPARSYHPYQGPERRQMPRATDQERPSI